MLICAFCMPQVMFAFEFESERPNCHLTAHEKSVKWSNGNYRPQRSWGKVMFLQASVILSTKGVCVCLSACWETPPPPGADPPRSRLPWEQTPPSLRSKHPPPGGDTRRRACWEIRSTHGRYASYWNAILFSNCFVTKLPFGHSD